MNFIILITILFVVLFITMMLLTLFKCGTLITTIVSALSAILGFGLQVLVYSTTKQDHFLLFTILLLLIFISIVLFIINVNIYFSNKIDRELTIFEDNY